ncbi:ATP-binding protein [Vibrio echinoideorum]|uniref:ATP-binding protein n=1 Tax=Vibrio echinoideorum TaxID=2100116 RepID=UPI001080B487|nr:ATP-binding protein [Vibrio echinoideorum]
MKNYQVNDVFTPASPAKVNFIERKQINTRIVRALQTKGKQVVIYGHSGSGKTSLIENKLKQVYSSHIKTNCMKGMTFENVMLDAFDQLCPYYLDETVQIEKNSVKGTIVANIKLIKAQIGGNNDSSTQAKTKRVLPPQLTGSSLAKMIGEAGLCWVLEDFHKIQDSDKEQLSQLMKVFMDHSDVYPDLKIIAVGAVNTARQVVQYDSEMRRRVSELKVPLMNEKEIHKIIEQGCNLLNITVEPDIYDEVWNHSNGVASICHQLCQLMCESEGLTETNLLGRQDDYVLDYSHLKYAQREYLEIESDTIKRAFDNAFKVKNSQEVLYIMAKMDSYDADISKIVDASVLNEYSLKKTQLAKALDQLCTEEFGELLKFDEDSHNYSFSDPFYKTFAQFLIIESQDAHSSKKKLSDSERQQLLNQAFSSLVGTYQDAPRTTSIPSGDSTTIVNDDLDPFEDEDDDVLIAAKEIRKLKRQEEVVK